MRRIFSFSLRKATTSVWVISIEAYTLNTYFIYKKIKNKYKNI